LRDGRKRDCACLGEPAIGQEQRGSRASGSYHTREARKREHLEIEHLREGGLEGSVLSRGCLSARRTYTTKPSGLLEGQGRQAAAPRTR
jgi:hypothetical protein